MDEWEGSLKDSTQKVRVSYTLTEVPHKRHSNYTYTGEPADPPEESELDIHTVVPFGNLWTGSDIADNLNVDTLNDLEERIREYAP